LTQACADFLATRQALYAFFWLAQTVLMMCEFAVFYDKEIVFRDVVYAKIEGNRVLLKDVLGVVKVLEGRRIIEVDVSSERLVLG